MISFGDEPPVPVGPVVDRLARVRARLRDRGVFALVCTRALAERVDVSDMLGRGRSPELRRARASAYADLARLGWSVHEIAEAFETERVTVAKRLRARGLDAAGEPG